MSGVGATPGTNYNATGTGLVGADGKPREGWGLVDAPPVLPTTPGEGVEAPKYGDVDAPPKSDGVPSEIKPASEPSKTYDSVPVSTPEKVEYTEPLPPPPAPKMIEVAGTGMGANKKFSMLEGEALAVYRTLRDNKSMKPEELAKVLKDKYGFDTEVTTIDGKKAVVNKATGNTLAWDGNGNGSLELGDMKFKEALLAAGIDPDYQADPKVFDLATKVIQQAIDASDKRRKENEAAYQKSLEAKQALEAKATAGTTGTPAPAGTATPTPAPVPSATPTPSVATPGAK